MEVTMISGGVEISIAGGVAETVDANYGDRFFFLFFLFFFFFFFKSRLLIVSIRANAQLCSIPESLAQRTFGRNEDHGVQNLQLQSIPRSPS